MTPVPVQSSEMTPVPIQSPEMTPVPVQQPECSSESAPEYSLESYPEREIPKSTPGLQTAPKTVTFATKNINLKVIFLLRSALATIQIHTL